MALSLSILYRSPLASCNYSCWYCPFAKRASTPAELEDDRRSIERFIQWVAGRDHDIAVLFTPYGEGLIHPWYRQAIQALSCMPHVTRVAAQTNLAFDPCWLKSCDLRKVALWCSYHPTQVGQESFLARCRMLDELRVRYSVGCVGIIEEIGRIEHLRCRLSSDVYLWVNAYKHQADYYQPEHVRRLEAVDPLFRLNNRRYRSAGRPCRTGRSVVCVYGDGTIRRCHLSDVSLGNIYESDIASVLGDHPCPVQVCDCHIGYVHMTELGLHALFGENCLERIPVEPIWRDASCREHIRGHVERVLRRESRPGAST